MKRNKAISKTVIGIIIVVIVIIAAVAAYEIMLRSSSQTSKTSSTTTSSSPAVSTPVTLNIITFSGTCAYFIQYAGKLFSQEHPGVTVNVITYPFSQYLNVELTALKAHSSQYDIIGFTSTSAQLVAPYLLPLNASLFNMSDLIGPQETFGGIIYNVTLHQNVTIGVAYDTAVYLTVYRASIFDNKTLQEEFYNEYHMNMSPTTWQNWTVVLAVDQFLTSHGITKYGFLIYDDEGHGIINSFPAIYGYYYSRDSSLNHGLIGGIPGFNVMFEGYILPGYSYPLPSFNSTAGVQALQTYKALVNYELPPTQVQVNYDNIVSYYPQAAGMFVFTTELSYLNSTELADTALAPLPSGYAQTGTDFLGISKYSTHVQLAEEFLQFLVSPKVQVDSFILYKLFPVSKTAFKELLANTSISAQQREWLSEVYSAALNAWANPPNVPITYNELIPSFNTIVLEYLQGSITDPNTALNQAASQWMNYLSSYYG